jgi:hypothetical protein
VHGAVWFSLARSIVVKVISFLIVILCVVTILGVVVGIIRISSRGSWCGNNWSDRSSWWRHLHCCAGKAELAEIPTLHQSKLSGSFHLCLNKVVGVPRFLLHRLESRR